jgi:hypothetical protein
MRNIGRNIAVLKYLLLAGCAGAALCVTVETAAARPGGGGGGGGHFGGGGGGMHFGGGGGGMHFGGGGGAMHFGGGATHFASPRSFGSAHFSPHFSSSHFSGAHVGHAFNYSHHYGSYSHHYGSAHYAHVHGGTSGGRSIRYGAGRGTNAAHLGATDRALSSAAHTHFTTPPGSLAHAHFAGDPHAFWNNRHFYGYPAFRPFLGYGWHPWYHLGWIGPVFWPFAYGDFFYYALWPWDYYDVDPFWAYGYGDIYTAIFTPYSYADYVEGPRAPRRMRALTQQVAESCDQETSEVTSWPIGQIQDTLQPNEQQRALLDDFGNAVVKASQEVRLHCPTNVAFTPVARLDAMHQRLAALVDAADIIGPPLGRFYDSLSDEQKARFNEMAPPPPQASSPSSQTAPPDQGAGQVGSPAPSQPQSDAAPSGASGNQAPPSIRAQCSAAVMAWPTDRIDQIVRPDGAQAVKLTALKSAVEQGADIIRSACPSEMPATPPARLSAMSKRLGAMLRAVETVQPALADFYNSLSDDQKARFNTLGRQLFAQNGQNQQ